MHLSRKVGSVVLLAALCAFGGTLLSGIPNAGAQFPIPMPDYSGEIAALRQNLTALNSQVTGLQNGVGALEARTAELNTAIATERQRFEEQLANRATISNAAILSILRKIDSLPLDLGLDPKFVRAIPTRNEIENSL